jgi:hypothetical protein
LTLFQVAALLLTDEQGRLTRHLGKAADQRPVIAEEPIPVDFHKVLGDQRHVIERIGAAGMTGKQNLVPGRQSLEKVAQKLIALRLQFRHIRENIAVLAGSGLLGLGDSLVEFRDQLFEFQNIDS